MFDTDAAAAHLAEAPTHLATPEGLPEAELARSPCAARVGALAAESGLFAFHYEHRAHLAPPEPWGPWEPPSWVDGRLPEPKYAAFRHDLPVAGFHPGHRAKWSAHELCHALVGFGWRADASPLWHATAARLAELLPVVLWYFLDEVRLSRCTRHDGPLFATFCPDCEAVAAPRPWSAEDATHLADARRFLDRELAAIARTRRLGLPIPHVHGSLDLCSDGVAYAAAHGPRLRSTHFGRYAERFLRLGQGWFDHLDDLEARVVAVARALTEGAPLAPIGHRALWAAQDLGWRLCAHAPDAPIDDLATELDLPAARAWVRRELPAGDADSLLAVGYGEGRSTSLVGEGLASVCPLTLELIDSAGGLHDFVRTDAPDRRNIGLRLADFLDRGTLDGPKLAALARYETALRTAAGDPEATVLGDGDGLRAARGLRVVLSDIDPIRLAERVEAGDIDARHGPLLVVHAGDPVPTEPTGVLVLRDPEGELILAEADAEVAAALARGDLDLLDMETLDDLRELGAVVACRWPLSES